MKVRTELTRKIISLMLIFVMTVGACVTMTGCGGKKKLTYPDGVETYTYTDDYGREVELRKDITKIVATGPNAQMILYTIAPEMLVGLAESPTSAQEKYFPDNYIDLPTLGQFYGKKTSLNLEALMTTETEIIIDVGEVQEDGAEDMDSIQEQTGIATIFIEGTMDSYPQAYEKLGKVLGKEDEAAELSAFCRETLDMAEKAKSKLKPEDVKTVMFGVNSTGLNANVEGNVQATVIDTIGAKNALSPEEGEEASGKDGGNPVNLEYLYTVEPDYIVFGPGGPYSTVKKNSQWNTLDAVKNNKYFETPGEPFSWMSAPPCVNQVLGVRWLGPLVYPKLYKNDIYKDAKKYYKLFWHYDLSNEELKRMLKNSYGK